MENNEDQLWLNVLSGKSAKSADKKTVLEAKLLRSAIKEYQAEEKVLKNTLDKLHSKMRREGLYDNNNHKSILTKINILLKKFRVFIIFMMGLLAGAMLPMELARNSENLIFKLLTKNNTQENIKSIIKITDKSPLSKSKEIIDLVISNNLQVKVKKNKEGSFELTIYGIEKMNVEQVALKTVIGLPNQADGTVIVNISSD